MNFKKLMALPLFLGLFGMGVSLFPGMESTAVAIEDLKMVKEISPAATEQPKSFIVIGFDRLGRYGRYHRYGRYDRHGRYGRYDRYGRFDRHGRYGRFDRYGRYGRTGRHGRDGRDGRDGWDGGRHNDNHHEISSVIKLPVPQASSH